MAHYNKYKSSKLKVDPKKHIQVVPGMWIRHEKNGTVVSADPINDVVVLFFKNKQTGYESEIPFPLSRLRLSDGRNLRYDPPLFHEQLSTYLIGMAVAMMICLALKMFWFAAAATLIAIIPQYFQGKRYSNWHETFDEELERQQASSKLISKLNMQKKS